jgi:hypothetical protein
MAFVKVSKSNTGASYGSGVEEVRLGYHLSNVGDRGGKSMYITITRALVDKLGWKVEQQDNGRNTMSVTIHEGTYEDAGFLMFENTDTGYTLGTNSSTAGAHHALSSSISISRIKHYAVNEPTEEKLTAACEFVINDDNTILVQCPDWLRYNSASVPEQPVKVEPVKEKEVLPIEEDEPPPTKPKITLNREDRRRIAKRVASQLGR